jgi:hypothetical protein
VPFKKFLIAQHKSQSERFKFSSNSSVTSTSLAQGTLKEGFFSQFKQTKSFLSKAYIPL